MITIGELMHKFGYCYWEEFAANEFWGTHMIIQTRYLHRRCRICGKVQHQDVHCLGLNPPEYVKTWHDGAKEAYDVQ